MESGILDLLEQPPRVGLQRLPGLVDYEPTHDDAKGNTEQENSDDRDDQGGGQ
ncbi:hypothetical protein [Microtetraspora sp. NBRC 13810]|uniref:hypothetical protein n=1 Tax=Microtetraspora sp. NBRC 13810 TaxID=3030990 RepID=UPI00331DFBDF